MTTKYSGEGNIKNVVLVAAVSSGDMLAIGKLLGVALTDGAIGDTVAFAIEGVYDLPAVTGAAFTEGESVLYDSSAGLIDDQAAVAASGDLSLGCIAMETLTAAAGDLVKVKLNVGPNTVTP